ncbi:MAG TPA: peptidase M23, partial [Rhodovulum sp.]|nr:peptidase M23 [Rhodovulum sp.]
MRRARALLVIVALAGAAPADAQSEPAETARAAAEALRAAARSLQDAEGARDRVAALSETIRAYEDGLA